MAIGDYTKTTYVDEVLAGSPTYNISGTGAGQTITMDQTVTTPGTAVNGLNLNNNEDKTKELDTEMVNVLDFVDKNNGRIDSNSRAITELKLQNDLNGRISDPVETRFGSDLTENIDISMVSEELSYGIRTAVGVGAASVQAVIPEIGYSGLQVHDQITLSKSGAYEEKIIDGISDSSAGYDYNTGAINNDSWAYMYTARVSDFKAIQFYYDGGTCYARAIIVNPSTRAVTYGTAYAMPEAYLSTQRSLDWAEIEENKIMVAYVNGSNGYGRALVLNITDANVITFGTPVTFSSGTNAARYVSVTKVATNEFVTAHTDVTNSDIGRVDKLTVSENTITVSAISGNVYESSEAIYNTVMDINSGALLVTWRDSSDQGRCKVGTWDDAERTSITWATEYTFYAGTVNYPQSIKMEDNKAVVGYYRGVGIYTKVISVSGTVCSFGTEHSVSSNYGTLHIDKMSSTKFIISWDAGGDYERYYYFKNVSGTTITSDGTVYLSAANHGIQDVLGLTSTTAIGIDRVVGTGYYVRYIYEDIYRTLTLSSVTTNSYSTSDAVVRNASNAVSNGETLINRYPIILDEAQDDIHFLLHVDTGVTVTAYASVVADSTDETYFALTEDEVLDLGDGTQEITFYGNASGGPEENMVVKVQTVNSSGSEKTLYKVLGGAY